MIEIFQIDVKDSNFIFWRQEVKNTSSSSEYRISNIKLSDLSENTGYIFIILGCINICIKSPCFLHIEVFSPPKS